MSTLNSNLSTSPYFLNVNSKSTFLQSEALFETQIADINVEGMMAAFAFYGSIQR